MTLPRGECFLVTKLQYFLSFKYIYIYIYNPDETNDKLVTSWSFLSGDVAPTSSKEKESDGLLCTVTRYGPQSVARGDEWRYTWDFAKSSASLWTAKNFCTKPNPKTYDSFWKFVARSFFFFSIRQVCTRINRNRIRSFCVRKRNESWLPPETFRGACLSIYRIIVRKVFQESIVRVQCTNPSAE